MLVEASTTAATVVLGAGAPRRERGPFWGRCPTRSPRTGTCPVVVVRHRASEDGAGAGQVVLALDDSESSTPAIEYAFAAASRQRLGVTAVHAWWREYLGGVMAHSPWEGDWSEVAQELEQMMERTLAGWCEKYPDVRCTGTSCAVTRCRCSCRSPRAPRCWSWAAAAMAAFRGCCWGR